MTGIVILTYETWKMTYRCVQSLFQAESNLEYKVYFVDNASKTPVPEEIKALLNNENQFYYIRSEKNKGYAAGNNLGIKQALADGCEHILIANNDVIFKEKSLTNMKKAFKKDTKIGIVGPMITDESGDIQPSRCSMRTGKTELLQVFTVLKKVFPGKYRKYYCLDQDAKKADYVYYVSGCCFMMSKECAKTVTPLDEHTILYYEELILGIQMENAGYLTWYEPESTVVHAHGYTTNQVKPFKYQCITQSENYYAKEYLKAGKVFLWLLRAYRNILYHFRCVKSKELRKYRKTYLEEIKR